MVPHRLVNKVHKNTFLHQCLKCVEYINVCFMVNHKQYASRNLMKNIVNGNTFEPGVILVYLTK